MSLLLAAAGALWLGLLTAASPCPLATNVAAVSYVGKRAGRPSLVLTGGLLYALGRALTYILVALLVLQGLLAASPLSRFLQQKLNVLLGPALLVLGLVLVDVIPWPWVGRGSRWFERLQVHSDRLGLVGAGLLGFTFALAFCPLSAALYFGSLLPLALANRSPWLLPAAYGLGTALPVIFFSFLLAFSANRVARAFSALTAVERWLRRATAAVFILVGAYYCLVYVLHVL